MACDRSSMVAPAPVPISPSATVTRPTGTISATIRIDGPNSLSAAATIAPLPVGQPVSFALTVETGGNDSVKDVRIDWGDGATDDFGAVSEAVAVHSFSTPGTFVLTTRVDTSAGRHITVPITLTVGR